MASAGVLREGTATDDVAASDVPEQQTTSACNEQSRTSSVQRAWEAGGIQARLGVLARARGLMAQRAEQFAAAISPELNRSRADSLVAEWIPLLAACRFLEREAPTILRTRRPGRRGLPLWLRGVRSEIERVPFGTVLVIGPANYPLLLPGVQALQALAAGNAVIWKPGRSGAEVARLFANLLCEAGLPEGLLRITDDGVAAATEALASGQVSKVFFTGSAEAGRAVLRQAAETATPCVAELSGSDALIVLPSADLRRVAKAVGFGLRLNGSATCMAPRRILLVGADVERRAKLVRLLQDELRGTDRVSLAAGPLEEVKGLLDDAMARGASVLGGEVQRDRGTMQPAVVLRGRAEMQIAQADVFAPVITMIEVADEAGLPAVQEQCAFALTAAIFGEERTARRIARELVVGTILINDVIVPTADPRVPFGGRRASGFGTTRGAEGLLEMTAARVISVRPVRSSTRHYERTTAAHLPLFAGLGAGLYAGSMAARWSGWKQVVLAARGMMSTTQQSDGEI